MSTTLSTTSRFEGKNVLITGGSGGIGRATAERILSEGGRVLVTGTNTGKLAAFQSEFPAVKTLANDAGDARAVQELATALESEFRHLDAAFLNAGYAHFAPHTEVTAEDFDRQYAVNVRGPILQAKAISPLMQEGGSIVINASVARNIALPGGVLYNSTKGSMRTVTRVLALEMADRRIRVNAVSPGPVGSDFYTRTGMSNDQIEKFVDEVLKSVPLRRIGQPEEVAAVAAFLLSDESSFVTGSEYVVDGGMTET